MNQTRARQFQRERADELRQLASILEQEGLVRDSEPLRHAASTCRVYRKDGRFFWHYDYDGLEFDPILVSASRHRHVRPRSVEEIRIEIQVSLHGSCLDDGDSGDPLQRLIVDCRIQGRTNAGDHKYCAWHLDKEGADANAEADSQVESGETHFVHPDYHFQYGGKRIWSIKDSDFGMHLLLESPRVAHPPLDGVLAVDFILSNYYGDRWNKLRRENSSYVDLMRSAQRRLWRPYALAASSFWDPAAVAGEWDAHFIWPHLN